MKLLHISFDYPDAINSNKTMAVKDILTATARTLENDCISLNRVSRKKNERAFAQGAERCAAVFGLPMGLDFRRFHRRAYLAAEGLGFDIAGYDMIFAHKLTFEGPVAYRMSGRHHVPFAVGLMQTDIRVLKARPDLRGYYRRILRDACGVTVAVHWIREALREAVGSAFFDAEIVPKLHFLPYIVRHDDLRFEDKDNGRFVTLVSMRKNYFKVKNMRRTLLALKAARELSGKEYGLDVYGDGPEMDRVIREAEALGLSGCVAFCGRVDNRDVLSALAPYRAFVLCSYPETFGMAYIEALRAGIPIIHSRNMAVDGFFDDYDCWIKVDHRSDKDIARALLEMDANHAQKKAGVKELQESGRLDAFGARQVAERFTDAAGKMVGRSGAQAGGKFRPVSG